MKKLFLTLILILLVSGCTGLPFDIPFLSSSSTQVKELPPDVISINNVTVLPSTSVRANDEFSIYFELFNQEEFNYTKVSYNLYDTGLCISKGGYPDISPDTVGPRSPLELAPQEIRQVEWTFQAPDADKIAHLKVTCPIRFRFDFSYNAKSQIDVLVIDSVHFTELQKAGEATTFSPTINVGRGPIKTYFDFGTSLPVKSGSELPVYIKVEDKGTGMLEKIGADNLTVTFPIDFTVPGGPDKACPYFNCTSYSGICTNYVDIPMISKKSLEIRCSGIKAASLDSGVPEKTYFISSNLNYNYYVAGEVDVEVNPQ
jgi:hypothetical protein